VNRKSIISHAPIIQIAKIPGHAVILDGNEVVVNMVTVVPSSNPATLEEQKGH
jgi:hypothetical protein